MKKRCIYGTVLSIFSFVFFGCETSYYLIPPQNIQAQEYTGYGKTKAIEITWDMVVGAEYYEVHRSTAQNGIFKKIGNAPANTFILSGKNFYIDDTVEKGKTYYYKIKSMSSQVYTFESILSAATEGVRIT
jgi:fibronectin type 3 domain-containing protein